MHSDGQKLKTYMLRRIRLDRRDTRFGCTRLKIVVMCETRHHPTAQILSSCISIPLCDTLAAIATHLLSKKSSSTLKAKNLACGEYLRPPSDFWSTNKVRASRHVSPAFCWIPDRYAKASWCKELWDGSDAIAIAWATWSKSCCCIASKQLSRWLVRPVVL